MNQTPLVSVIVPTKNSATTLDACLKSISEQTYQNVEIVVVDNSSTDDTQLIAKRYTSNVFTKGPERSAQRNFGVRQAKGDYVLIIDSDMELNNKVVAECVEQFNNGDYAGLVIPEESFGEGFWAQCKKLERSFYVGVNWMEAARAFPRNLYLELGGYNEEMVSGEDWDLSQRASKMGTISRINSYIMHNEGHLRLWVTLNKKFYYAQKFAAYTVVNAKEQNVSSQTGPIQRYKLFLRNPRKLFKSPLLGCGVLVMKTLEFAVGAFGLLSARFRR